jgi:hypothetical protein
MRAVILPSSALDALARRAVELPMLFQIENPATGQRSHCGVMEFIADEGMCYMPHWVRAPAARSFVPLPFPSLPFPSALSVTQSEQMCVCVCVWGGGAFSFAARATPCPQPLAPPLVPCRLLFALHVPLDDGGVGAAREWHRGHSQPSATQGVLRTTAAHEQGVTDASRACGSLIIAFRFAA